MKGTPTLIHVGFSQPNPVTEATMTTTIAPADNP
jgi:hypothetical protein